MWELRYSLCVQQGLEADQLEDEEKQQRIYLSIVKSLDSLLLVTFKKTDSLDVIQTLCVGLAEVGDFERSNTLLKSIIADDLENNMLITAANGVFNWSYNLLEMGDTLAAGEKILEAWAIVDTTTLFYDLEYISEGAAHILASAERYEEAYHFQKLHDSIKEVSQSKNVLANMKVTDGALLLKLSNLENEKLEGDVKYQKHLAWGITTLCLVLLAGVIMMFVSGKKRKKLLTQVQDQHEELNDHNQFNTRIISILSHDFRSPINSLNSITTMAKAKILTNEEFKEVIGEIDEQLEATSSYIGDLLYWAKSRISGVEGKVSKFELEGNLQQISQSLRLISKEKEIGIVSNIEKGMMIETEETLINIVLRNLLHNALKFSPSKSRIEVSAKKVSKGWELFIRDFGVGMTKEELGRLFTSEKTSTQGTQSEQGSGMGLVLCRDLMRALGGNLSAESKKGVGTTMFLFIPKK